MRGTPGSLEVRLLGAGLLHTSTTGPPLSHHRRHLVAADHVSRGSLVSKRQPPPADPCFFLEVRKHGSPRMRLERGRVSVSRFCMLVARTLADTHGLTIASIVPLSLHHDPWATQACRGKLLAPDRPQIARESLMLPCLCFSPPQFVCRRVQFVACGCSSSSQAPIERI